MFLLWACLGNKRSISGNIMAWAMINAPHLEASFSFAFLTLIRREHAVGCLSQGTFTDVTALQSEHQGSSKLKWADPRHYHWDFESYNLFHGPREIYCNCNTDVHDKCSWIFLMCQYTPVPWALNSALLWSLKFQAWTVNYLYRGLMFGDGEAWSFLVPRSIDIHESIACRAWSLFNSGWPWPHGIESWRWWWRG